MKNLLTGMLISKKKHPEGNFIFKEDIQKTVRVMKATSLFLLLGIYGASASTYAQTARLNVEAQGEQISEVLKDIEEQSEYTFVYDVNELDLNRRVSISAQDASVNEVLDKLFSGAKIKYVVTDRHIALYAVTDKVQQNSDKKTITGTVVDKDGIPVIGANIVEKGTTNGTVTDLDGKFSLNVTPGTTLQVSYIGYNTQELKVGEKSVYNITLKEDAEALDELVVVGYGTQKKVNLTGAVSQIEASDFVEDRPVVQLGQSLQGKVPGLQVSRSNGKPGEGYEFNIRGTTSLNEASPLILVDGVEMDPNIVPPEDVESISVLKDASSAAIYGARAAFGVVLITTKKGKMGQKLSINYSNNFSWSKTTTTPEKVDPVTQIKMGGYAWGNKSGNYDSYWAHSVKTWVDLYETVAERNTYRIVDGIFYPIGDVNLVDKLTETGFVQRHNISVNGGSETIAYYASAGLTQQDGILISDRDKYSRKNVNITVNTNITDWLSAQVNTGYIRSKNEFPYIPNGESYLYSVCYLRPTFWLTGQNDINDLPYGFGPGLVELGAPNYESTDNYNLQIQGTIKPLKGLEITGRYTFRSEVGDKFNHVNKYEVVDPESGAASYYKNEVNSLQRDNSKSNYNVVDIWGQYETLIKNDHSLRFMLGYNQESYSFQNVWAKGEGLLSDNVPSLNLAVGNTFVGDETLEWSTRSVFFRGNYDYKGKYLLEIVGRYDGSSKFPKNDRFTFLPSASVGWRVSEEKFMSWSRSKLDNLKLRFSYGKQGNQGIDPYAYIPTLDITTANWIVSGKTPVVLTSGGIVSNNFTWESVKNMNIGMDFSMFNNKLNATLEYYIRRTNGMLMPGEVLPSVLGTDVPKENAADLRVNGWELSIGWNDKIGADFSYNISAIISDSKSVITKYANPTGLITSHYEGEVLGEIWGYETDRFFTADDFITDVEGNRTYKDGIPTQDIIFDNYVPMPGDVKYKDLNKDGKVDYGNNTLSNPGDKKIIGNETPRYQFGLNLGIAYKNFDISAFFQGVGKRDLWIDNSLIFAFSESYESVFKQTSDVWTEENTNAYYPRPIADRNWNRQVQTKYLQNAAYVRLKNLTIGYNLPTNILKKIYLTKVRLYVSGENLFTITGLPSGIDPELGGNYAYPFSRDFSLGIDVRF